MNIVFVWKPFCHISKAGHEKQIFRDGSWIRKWLAISLSTTLTRVGNFILFLGTQGIPFATLSILTTSSSLTPWRMLACATQKSCANFHQSMLNTSQNRPKSWCIAVAFMNFLMFLSPLSWRKAFCLSITNDGLTMARPLTVCCCQRSSNSWEWITRLLCWWLGHQKEATANLNKIFPKYSTTKWGTK